MKSVNIVEEDMEYILTLEPQANDIVISVNFSWADAQDPTDSKFSGYVKWDGCINFDGGDVMMHLCGPQEAARLARWIRTVYREAHELFPSPDYELSECEEV